MYAQSLPRMSAFDRSLRLLIVDDNQLEAMLLKHALLAHCREASIRIVDDGQQALDFLHGVSQGRHAPLPDIIILDLSLPRRNGHQVLEAIKAQPALRSIPVIMFTSSTKEEDIRKAYDLHVNCYVTKPVDQAKWAHAVAVIEMFWLQTATLPRPAS
jgi:chemotaxis family two-component system response regulator Rcp1